MTDNVYKFQHTYDLIQTGQNRGRKFPLWLIAQDPFSDIEAESEGYIVHLGHPRFVSRWYEGEEPVNPMDTIHGLTFSHTDLDISLCEITFLEDDKEPVDLTPWLAEACCAVAHYQGDLATIEPDAQ